METSLEQAQRDDGLETRRTGQAASLSHEVEEQAAEEHPTYPRLPAEAVERMGQDWCDRYNLMRNAAIEAEKRDPLKYGYEPPIWKLADFHRAELRRLTPSGVIHEVNLGGNRASKTERAAKRIIQAMIKNPGYQVWCCDSTQAQSRQNQMRLLWKYFPTEWKNTTTGKLQSTATTKVRYTQAGGFTEDTFVFPNGSQCWFKFYGMDVEDLEGPELDVIWGDELIPLDWIETLVYRLVTRNGLMHVTFTPKKGYTPTVGHYLDGARTIEEVEAELLPIWAPRGRKDLSGGVESRHAMPDRDGTGSGDPASGVPRLAVSGTATVTGGTTGAGVTPGCTDSRGSSAPPAQNNSLVRSEKSDAEPTSTGGLLRGERHSMSGVTAGETAKSTARDVSTSLDMTGGKGAGGEMEIVGYKKRPRVQLCDDAKARIIYFHTSDNPYGNYEAMKAEVKGKPEQEVDMRVYGYVTKAAHTQFPTFKDNVHVLSMNQWAAVLERWPNGTRYQLVDPCSGRNWFWIYVYFPFPKKCIIYREWPSYGHTKAYIPGAGDIGPWALPSRGSKRHDGEPGPGQDKMGFGLIRYKEEMLRVEGGEKIYERWIDSRYSNATKTEREGETTLIEQMEDIGMRFIAMDSEKNILGASDGSVDMIDTALQYDTETELGKFSASLGRINEPWLQVVENCPNVIFSLKNWTGKDGQHGACKDPIDVVRGLFLSELEFHDESLLKPHVPWMARRR